MRTRIQSLVIQVDSLKARAGAALGGAVFMLLLSALFVFDIVSGKTSAWLAAGLDKSEISLLAAVLGLAGVLLLCLGIFKLQPAARKGASRLADLERQYDRLLGDADADPRLSKP